jgi:ketosteroid isomerase-like protein
MTMGNIMTRLGAAINDHDLDAFVSLFATDYQSDQPAHPMRSFSGADKVRENWSSVFAGIHDLKAELLTSATTGDGMELGEWHWHGTHLDGSPFAMRGVIVIGVRGEEIMWGRLYMEPVEQGGTDIDEMVRETYRPPEGG